MNNSKLLGLLAAMFITLSIFSSCTKDDIDETKTTETETTTFDCPSLSLNIGDTCTNASGNFNIVDTNCDCPDYATYDCPSLNANIGDACTTSSGANGVVDANCDCEENGSSVDCQGWGLNIGDDCIVYDLVYDSTAMTYDSININGVLDINCDCL